MRFAVAAFSLVAGVTCAIHAHAQAPFPAKPIRLIVPLGPGGTGTGPQMAFEQMKLRTGLDIVHIP